MSQHDADLEDCVRKVREALAQEPYGTEWCSCVTEEEDGAEVITACARCSTHWTGVDAFEELVTRCGLEPPGLTQEEAAEEMAALLRRAERDVGERN